MVNWLIHSLIDVLVHWCMPAPDCRKAITLLYHIIITDKKVDEKIKMENQTSTGTSTIYQNKEIEEFLQSDYVNIKDGESRTLEFLKNRETIVDKKDFNGLPLKRVQFIVTDTTNPTLERKERKFEVSRKHVPKIYDALKKGYSVLEILRVGAGKETQYRVRAIR